MADGGIVFSGPTEHIVAVGLVEIKTDELLLAVVASMTLVVSAWNNLASAPLSIFPLAVSGSLSMIRTV